MLRVLTRAPLNYTVVRVGGSHYVLEAEGRLQIVLAVHGDSIPSGLVRKILTTRAGLTEEEALGVV